MRKLLIANRGEIAVRIIRAAHAMGVRTVQAVSEADKDMLAARLADEVVIVGPAKASKSYMNGPALIEIARAANVDAIHPGYGFLSENAAFATDVRAAGITFVGPDPQTISSMGDKANARETAKLAGVSVVPGSERRVNNADEAAGVAYRIGYPVMLKAAAGGGGRGIRVVAKETELREVFEAASREAVATFDDGGLYVEKYIPRARHIEVQILGDGDQVVHLFERECSVQRRRQKLWEEAPAPGLSPRVRQALYASAVRLGEQIGYRGAGTIEFLYDDASERFFFMEMNTRLQVEHPVTEMVTGIDIVRETLRLACGEPLSVSQMDIALRGHAVECRINAEDVSNGFMPSIGTISVVQAPGGPGVRFDTGIYAGYDVPPFYDSLLGKLIVWDEDREGAIRRLNQALDELVIDGVTTTADLYRAIIQAPDITSGSVYTAWLETQIELGLLSTDLRKGRGEHAEAI